MLVGFTKSVETRIGVLQKATGRRLKQLSLPRDQPFEVDPVVWKLGRFRQGGPIQPALFG